MKPQTKAFFLYFCRLPWWINHSFLCDFDLRFLGSACSTPAVSNTTLSSSSFGGQVCVHVWCDSLQYVAAFLWWNELFACMRSHMCLFVYGLESQRSLFFFSPPLLFSWLLCRLSVWEWVEPETRVQERRQQAWACRQASIPYSVDWDCQSAAVSGHSGVADSLRLL